MEGVLVNMRIEVIHRPLGPVDLTWAVFVDGTVAALFRDQAHASAYARSLQRARATVPLPARDDRRSQPA